MNLFNIITLLGGLGLFLYGMKLLGDALEQAAGKRMQSIIEKLTGNLLKGIGVGTGVTALIQSSSATTVMVIGFVNAGIMTLKQATGVIMGANIGTTVTSQILRLGDISNNIWYLELLKPKNFAGILLVVGAFLVLFTKKKKLNIWGSVLTGFGVLFIGMATMESGVSELKHLPQFEQAFVSMTNPIFGVLVGLLVTVIVQSSSASIGILQAAASTGVVTFAAAIPIIMGQNIGTCITALLSSIGANKNAKRAAAIHLSFNVIGTIVFMGLIYIVYHIFKPGFWDSSINRGGIADFHLFFNIANTLLLLPFAGMLVSIANFFIKGTDEKKHTTLLDERFLTTPSVAVAQSVKEIISMANIAKQNIGFLKGIVIENDNKNLPALMKNEDILDNMEIEIGDYIGKVIEKKLTENEHKLVTSQFHIINDIERIGDHVINITQFGEENGYNFTPAAAKDLATFIDSVEEIVGLAIEAYRTNDVEIANKVEPFEQVIDLLQETLQKKHIERVATKECNIKASLVYMEILSSLERMSDHASNMAVITIQLNSHDEQFNSHKYLHNLHISNSEEYKATHEYYLNKYLISNGLIY